MTDKRDWHLTVMWHGVPITYGFIDEGGMQYGDRYFIKIEDEVLSAKHIKVLVEVLQEFSRYTSMEIKRLEKFVDQAKDNPAKRAGHENAPYPPNNVKDKDD